MAKNGNLKTYVTVVSGILGIAIIATSVIVAAVRVESKVEAHAEQAIIDLATNAEEHAEYEEDIETLDDEGHAMGMDVLSLTVNVNHIRAEQARQAKRDAERHIELIDKIKELHK